MHAKDLLEIIAESGYHTERKIVIRDGKREAIVDKVYDEPCPDGYKRVDGKCERMSREEITNRSKAADKAANNPITKRNQAISRNRRDALISD